MGGGLCRYWAEEDVDEEAEVCGGVMEDMGV